MSQVYEGYERQYCELSANLSRKCNSAAALPDGDKKKQEVSELQAGLDDADVLIRKMDLEARSLQPSVKATLLAKLREYKSDLNNLKREVKKLTMPSSGQPAHEDLLESGMAGGREASANQRGRLAMSTERLNQSTDRVRESRRAALETEELGVSILEDLHQQRETLLHSHKKMRHRLGTGRWLQVKRSAFNNADHRTRQDLKDKWKTLVHMARISHEKRQGDPVPQPLLDRVLTAHERSQQP
ncbi:Vesicle transport v-SNARE 12 [Orobanche gracilis]